MIRTTSTSLAIINQTPSIVSSGSPNRVSLYIQNKSNNSVYFKFGSTISQVIGMEPLDGFELGVEGFMIIDQHCPTEQLFMSADADNSPCLIMEINEVAA